MDNGGNLKRKSACKLVELNVVCKETQLSRKQEYQDNLFILCYLKGIKKYKNKELGNKLLQIVPITTLDFCGINKCGSATLLRSAELISANQVS